MANRVGDRRRASLRDAEQREAFKPGGLHDGFQVAHGRLERNVFDIAVREAVAACVVADQRVVPRQLAIKMPPDRALEIEFEMRHPISGFDQLWPAADARIGELHAISRSAKLNLLFVPRFGSMSVWSWLISNGLSEFGLRQRFDLFRGEPKDANGPQMHSGGDISDRRAGQKKRFCETTRERDLE